MRAYETYVEDGIIVEHLPSPYARSWVAIGAEADIRHLLKTWSDVYRFRLDQIPDDTEMYWDLQNALVQRKRRGTVRVVGDQVEIDRRRLKSLRDGVDFLFDHLAEEHHEDKYEWFDHVDDWVRRDSAPQPITELEDARLAIEIIDTIMDISADNVVRLFDGVIA